jgi:paraquat-inducible protein B
MTENEVTAFAPRPARVETRRRFSPIWLIPIVTVLIAAYLAWDTLSKRGPLITITFENAEGLVAGQAQVKFKEVTMGQVQGIELSPDLTHVTVTARMNPESERLLTEHAQFWVVKPRLFAGNISGLETVLSGSYVQILPSTAPGKSQRKFTGLENPPVLQTTTPGRDFHLKADRLGSINLGSPVFYRGLTVGEVLGYDIGDMADSVTIHAFVRAPFDKYVREESHFWNASGVSLQVGAEGVRLQVESLRALLLGGIAFETPDGLPVAPVTDPNFTWPLFADQATADAAGYTRRLQAVAYFPGAVDGLGVGSPVTLRGIRIGQVTGVKLEYDRASDSIVVPVRFEVEPDRVALSQEAMTRTPLENARSLVARGMRAQVQTANLLTGQKAIALEFIPDAAPAEVRVQDGLLVIPAVPDQFNGIIQSATALMAKLTRMPFDQIGDNLNTMLAGLSKTVNGPEFRQTLTSLQAAMLAAKDTLNSINAGVGPAVKRLPEIAAGAQDAVNQANRLLKSVDSGYGDNSKFYRNLDRLLVQANDMAQSLRVLSDILARHPEALIRGRPDVGLTK